MNYFVSKGERGDRTLYAGIQWGVFCSGCVWRRDASFENRGNCGGVWVWDFLFLESGRGTGHAGKCVGVALGE